MQPNGYFLGLCSTTPSNLISFSRWVFCVTHGFWWRQKFNSSQGQNTIMAVKTKTANGSEYVNNFSLVVDTWPKVTEIYYCYIHYQTEQGPTIDYLEKGSALLEFINVFVHDFICKNWEAGRTSNNLKEARLCTMRHWFWCECNEKQYGLAGQ